MRRLLQHEGGGQGRRNRGQLEARKTAERRRGGRECERHEEGERGFLTGGGDGRYSLNASLSWELQRH